MGRSTTAMMTGAAIVAAAVAVVATGPGPAATPEDGAGRPLVPSTLGVPDDTAIAAGLRTGSSCTEVAAAMEQLLVETGSAAPGWGRTVVPRALDDTGGTEEAAEGAASDESAEPDAVAAGTTGVGDDGTNVQVAGVDEPDVVERVGDVTVVGTQGVLRVVSVGPAGAPVLRGELPLGAWSELQLLAVDEGRVVAIVRDGSPQPVRGVPEGEAVESPLVVPAWTSTSVALVDVADPDAPRELSRLDLEGRLVDARMVDGVVRIAVSGDGPAIDVHALGPFEADRAMDWREADAADVRAYEEALAAEHEQRVARAMDQLTPSDWQPHVRVTGPDGATAVEPLVACDRIGFPTSFAGVGTLTVAAIDATGDGLAIDDAASVVTSGEQLYSTADRLVVATTRWEPCCPGEPAVEEPPLPEVDPFFDDGDDGAREVEEGAVGADEPAGATAVAGSRAVVDVMPVEPRIWWGRGDATDLHVFDVDGTVVSHVASGTVDGWLLNQYSMSLHEGVLRVATTGFDDGDGRTESAVTTFRVEGAELVRLGAVDGLGPDEEIKSVRFMGDVAYVVTFRRTDPLYVVDLAVPTAPRALGELKIEGYSAYLHPLGPGRLLGVGQDADPATGATRGVQVSTFDVSDPTAPDRVDVDVTPGSTTEVEWDPHALTITRTGTVLVPFEQWGRDGSGQPRLGVLVYEVSDAGALSRVGVLDHGTRWELRPRRTVDLDEVLLTVGEQGVTTWDAATFESLGAVTFPPVDPAARERRFEEGALGE